MSFQLESHLESIVKCIYPASLIVILVAALIATLCGRLWTFMCCLRRHSRRVDCMTPVVFDEESAILHNDDNNNNCALPKSHSIFLDLNDFEFYSKNNDNHSSNTSSKIESSTNSTNFENQDNKQTIISDNISSIKVSRLMVPIKDSLINISKSIQDKISPKKIEKNTPTKKGNILPELQNDNNNSSIATTPNSECSYKNVYHKFGTPFLTVSDEDKQPEHIQSNILHCICFKQSPNCPKIIEKHVHSAKYKKEPILLEYGFQTPPTTPGKVLCSTVEAHLSSLQGLCHPNIAQLTGILSLNNIFEYYGEKKVQPMSDYAATNELLVYKQQPPQSITAPITSQSKCRRSTNEFGCFKSGLAADKETFNNVTQGTTPLKMDVESLKSVRELCPDNANHDGHVSAACASLARHLFSRKVFLHYFAWHNCHGPSLAEVIHGNKLPSIELQLRSTFGFPSGYGCLDTKSEDNSQLSICSKSSVEMKALSINRFMKLALLNDIVQAMLYLESTGLLKYHGILNLRNCYLDSRLWRAKVSGYGWYPILEAVKNDATFGLDKKNDNNHGNDEQQNANKHKVNNFQQNHDQHRDGDQDAGEDSNHEQCHMKYSNAASSQHNKIENICFPASLTKIDLFYVAPEHLSDVYSFFQASSFFSIMPSSSSSSSTAAAAAAAAAELQSSSIRRERKFGSSAGDVYSFSFFIYQFIYELLPYETYFQQYNFEQILQNIYDPKFNQQTRHKGGDQPFRDDDDDDVGVDDEHNHERQTTVYEIDDRCSTNQLKGANHSTNTGKITDILVKQAQQESLDKSKNYTLEYFRPKLISKNQFRQNASDDSDSAKDNSSNNNNNNNNLNINNLQQPTNSLKNDQNMGEYNILIELMQNCWKHNPDERPTFEEISGTITVMQIYNDSSKIKAKLNDKTRMAVNKERNLLEYSDNESESDRIRLVLDMFRRQNRKLEAQNILSNTEKFKSQKLLNRVLPSTVSRSLLMGEFVKPEKFDSVTIAFSDIVGFTTLASYSTPFQVVEVLNNLFTAFDLLLKRFDVYKLETIGDAYMVASGVPIRNDNHECQIALLTLEMLKVCSNFKIEHMPGVPLKIRVGIHTGPVVGGVVGTENPRYCLFGDTVNIASRLESTGQPNMIHVSRATQKALKASNAFVIKYRDSIELRGRGRYPTYWLLGTKRLDQPNDDVIRSLTEQESSSLEEMNGHGITDESIFTSIGLKQHEI